MRRKRIFYALPHDERCRADRKPLKDGSGARCMLKRAEGRDVCARHAKMIDAGLMPEPKLKGCNVSTELNRAEGQMPELRKRYFGNSHC